MIKIALIGKGNVGSHLEKALNNAGFIAESISSRDEYYHLDNPDLIIISVKDDAIGAVISRLSGQLNNMTAEDLRFDATAADYSNYPVIAHTSGSVGIEILKDNLPLRYPCGVIYPMQTFSRNIPMRYNDIPFLIEATDRATLENLKEIASNISDKVIEAGSAVRANYHIGAVLACNFANHLYALAEDFLKDKGLDFNILLPLLRQSVAKLEGVTPREAQTGPAVRGDKNVIEYHLSRLKEYPKLQTIYTILSDSIQDFYGNHSIS